MLKVPAYYQHYKGGIYYALTLAEEEATNKIVVVYMLCSSGNTYTRPLKEFEEKFSELNMAQLSQALFYGDPNHAKNKT